jgi:hypothetical protein
LLILRPRLSPALFAAWVLLSLALVLAAATAKAETEGRVALVMDYQYAGGDAVVLGKRITMPELTID